VALAEGVAGEEGEEAKAAEEEEEGEEETKETEEETATGETPVLLMGGTPMLRAAGRATKVPADCAAILCSGGVIIVPSGGALLQ
jgi:hypothetical protein